MSIRIEDSAGQYSVYKLPLTILAFSDSMLNYIQNVTLVSPQSYLIKYSDILKQSLSYDLKSSISVVSVDGNIIPSWMEENSVNYTLNILTNFTLESTLKFAYKFKVVDDWGVAHYSNIFYVIILKNQAPIAVASIPNATFYEGQLSGIIPTPAVLFSDPGDTLDFIPTLCIQYDSQAIIATYEKDKNYISVRYPPRFHAFWRLALVAKDSVSHYTFIYFDITVQEWAQTSCIKWEGSQVSDWSEWDDNYILNRKTGEWIAILTIYSLASVKIIGISIFFLLAYIILPVSFK